jgi:hypothetical protein
MQRLGIFTLLVLCTSAGAAGESKDKVRPVSEAESVLAVYREDHGLFSGGRLAVILIAWPDGHIVWSRDRVKGGAPYRAGRVEPKRVAGLLARFEKDGLFGDAKLNQAHFGPDSPFTTVFIKSRRKHVNMRSWHELFEVSDDLVVDDAGVGALEGRRRLDVLRKTSADYLFFRFVWSETRSRLRDLLPDESETSTGRPVMKGGVLSWRE